MFIEPDPGKGEWFKRTPILICRDGYKDRGMILWFGVCGATYVYVRHGGDVDSSLEACAEMLAPGFFSELEYDPCSEHDTSLEYDGCNECRESIEEAESDMTYTESGWIPSWEWGIVAEDVAPRDVLKFWRGEL